MSDYVYARHSDLHTSPEITWSLCDRCGQMICTPPAPQLARIGRGKWKYVCVSNGQKLSRDEVRTMTTEKCPRGEKLSRRGVR